jgi:ATP-binding cassette subfamily F protein uup
VLDEPTNDLDLETMDFLEGLLLGFPGTIILVSHDREFLDQVVTAVLVIDDKGGISEYVGGYEDRYLFPSETRGEAKRLGSSQTRDEKSKAPKSKKLGFKEKRELEELPGKIESLEREKTKLSEQMMRPDFFRQNKATISAATERMQTIDQLVTKLMTRWEALELLRDD